MRGRLSGAGSLPAKASPRLQAQAPGNSGLATPSIHTGSWRQLSVLETLERARAPERKGRGRTGPRSRWRGRVTSDAEVGAPCGRLGRKGGVSLLGGVSGGGPPGFLDQSKGRKESHVLVNNKLG